MLRAILIFTFLVATFLAKAQTASIDPVTQEPIFTLVDKYPEYPGGVSELMNFLAENIQYPDSAIKKGVEGTVFLSFVVGIDGELSNITVVKGLTPEINEESLRVLKSMPRWEPGLINDTKVRVMYQLPLKFKLQEEL